MRDYILAVNPGSTSTKAAVFKGEDCIKQQNLSHCAEELGKFERIVDQFNFRTDAVINWLNEEKIELCTLAAVVGRGGLLRPMPSGTYIVTDAMIEDLKIGIQGEHAANLGGMIAREIGNREGIPSFIVDPVAVDEFEDLARLSGLPELPRKSLVHALNIRAVSRKIAEKLGMDFEDINLIAAHLGGGISIAPVRMGRIIDVNNSIDEGPFSPDRSGSIPVGSLIRLCYSGKYNQKQLKKKIVGDAGLVGYLGTNDSREVEKMIQSGNQKAKLVFEAMCYQISKEIAAMATVLCGEVDAIVLTGGLAYNKHLVQMVTERVKFIAPVEVVPGENEMLSLAQGACRVLTGRETAKVYENEVLDK